MAHNCFQCKQTQTVTQPNCVQTLSSRRAVSVPHRLATRMSDCNLQCESVTRHSRLMAGRQLSLLLIRTSRRPHRQRREFLIEVISTSTEVLSYSPSPEIPADIFVFFTSISPKKNKALTSSVDAFFHLSGHISFSEMYLM